MATRHSKSKRRSSRNSRPPAIKIDRLALQDTIETERRRLQQAESILSCISTALDHREWKLPRIDYADAIDAAVELVLESINQLDRINLLRPRSSEQE